MLRPYMIRDWYTEKKREWANTRLLLPSLRPKCSRRKTVLLMSWSFYGGGAEKVICALAQALSEKYRVILLGFEDKGKTWPLPASAEVVFLPLFHDSAEEEERLRIRYIRNLKRSRRVFACISFMYRMNRLNIETKGCEKVILAERNDPILREPEHFEEIGGLYEKADFVIFQSRRVMREFGPAVQKKSRILPNPVSVPVLRTPPQRQEIVTMGRLGGQKNHAMLIRAFAQFRKTHPGYTLAIYGKGELEGELRELASSLGAADAVRICPHTDSVHEAIAHAEIFALSSDYEGMSNALLECMMMGFPCVTTKSGGAAEIIENGVNGMLTAPGSENEMAEALAYLADHPEMREQIGRNAAKTAESFRMETACLKWLAFLEEIERA